MTYIQLIGKFRVKWQNQISKLSIDSKLETKPTWIVGGHVILHMFAFYKGSL